MTSKTRRRLTGIGLALAATAALASCKIGVTTEASQLSDTSAVLNGRAYSKDAGPVTHWFEYGTTEALGSTTPRQVFQVEGDGQQVWVESTVTGLAEGTTYRYRSCASDAGGRGLCGEVKTFTTTSGRDSVSGLGVTSEMPSLGYHVGARLELASGPDGSNPTGELSVSPGSHHFRWPDTGPITCMRVEGNRVTIGFIADVTDLDPGAELIPRLLFIEDNGPTGDRFQATTLTAPATTCPAPASVGASAPTLVRGDFVVHDHTG